MIAIDGMMPKSCDKCMLVNEYGFCKITNDFVIDEMERPVSCPIKPVVTFRAAHIITEDEKRRFTEGTLYSYISHELTKKMMEVLKPENKTVYGRKRTIKMGGNKGLEVCEMNIDIVLHEPEGGGGDGRTEGPARHVRASGDG